MTPAVGDPATPSRTLTQVLAVPLVWAVRLYQLVLSPMLAQQCRFYPSCSAYAVTALTRFGVFRGSWLVVRRLARCHPWNPGGVDHVPPKEAGNPVSPPPRTIHGCAPAAPPPDPWRPT
ncbi:MAG: membrane protein insertion efficiency factor YidD [Dermatophilaceae bacterium]